MTVQNRRIFFALLFLLAAINHEITAQTGKGGGRGSADGPESSKNTSWQALIVAVIAAAGALGGSALGQRITAKEKRKDEMLGQDRRLETLRTSLRAELTQLIDSMEGERDYLEKKPAFHLASGSRLLRDIPWK